MPLNPDALKDIRDNLEKLAAGERAPMIVIGYLTENQFNDINAEKRRHNIPEVTSNEIVFIGRHLFGSRSKDGYTVDDMLDQIVSAMADTSVVLTGNKPMTAMRIPIGRADRYGNIVHDEAVFEATIRLPRMELFSVIPKGEKNKPHMLKSQAKIEKPTSDGGLLKR